MEKKQIWINQEDYERLKSYGSPGESVAQWMHNLLEEPIWHLRDLELIHAIIVDGTSEPVKRLENLQTFCEARMKFVEGDIQPKFRNAV